MSVAMHDADRVDLIHAFGQRVHDARRAGGVERKAGFAHRVAHALLQGGALEPAVHVLERDPRQLEALAEGLEAEGAGVEQPHHERRGRDALVQAARARPPLS